MKRVVLLLLSGLIILLTGCNGTTGVSSIEDTRGLDISKDTDRDFGIKPSIDIVVDEAIDSIAIENGFKYKVIWEVDLDTVPSEDFIVWVAVESDKPIGIKYIDENGRKAIATQKANKVNGLMNYYSHPGGVFYIKEKPSKMLMLLENRDGKEKVINIIDKINTYMEVK